ncbi:hypothetical protein C5B94_03075 [Clavibacter michiganensis]|nr:hypothetical protein C5B94_03075 [Clavibacter michiganensis]
MQGLRLHETHPDDAERVRSSSLQANERMKMLTDDEIAEAGLPPPEGNVHGADLPDKTLAHLVNAVLALAEDLHEASIPWWDPLTGLQILLFTTIVRGGGMTRTDLGRDCRTSRGAISPGLASLVRQGYVTDTPAGVDSVLTLGPAGRDLLERIDHARVSWIRRALRTHPHLSADDVQHLIDAVEHLRGSSGAPR